MNISAQSKVFSNPRLMKQRFDKAAAKAADRAEVVDKLERMGAGFLSLDQSKHDLDKTPGKVFVGNDKGMMAEVVARPFGGILSMEVLDETSGKAVEHKIEPDMFGTTYSTQIGGVEREVYDSGNGLLALMDEMKLHAPKKKKKAKKPKESEAPKEGDKPKEGDAPQDSEKPKESDKGKKK